MKKMKKFFAFVMTFLMILGVNVFVNAADTVTATVQGLQKDETIYYAQILQLNAKKDGYELTTYGKTAVYVSDTQKNSGFTEAKILDILVGKDGLQSSTGDLATLLAWYGAHMPENPGSATATVKENESSATATFSANAGAYVVKAVSNTPGTIYTPMMLVSTEVEYDSAGNMIGITMDEDATVTVKKSTTGVDKSVTDTKDDSTTSGGSKDINSYSVGDTIHYQVKIEVPGYPEGSTNHTLYIYDKFEDGITFVPSVPKEGGAEGETELTVKYQIVAKNAAPDASKYVAVNDKTADGKLLTRLVTYTSVADVTDADFALYFDYDLLKLSNAYDIYVIYQGKVNEKAIVGQTGNKNKVTEIYPKDPNVGEGYKPGNPPENPSKPSGKDDYPFDGYDHREDEEKIYTYGFYIVKTDEKDQTKILKGAEFDVYTEQACTNKVGSFVTDENGIGGFAGLKAGTYWLKETKAPAGYALLSNPVSVTTNYISSAKVKKTTTISSWQGTVTIEYGWLNPEDETLKEKKQATNRNGQLLYLVGAQSKAVTTDKTDWPAYEISRESHYGKPSENTEVTYEDIYTDAKIDISKEGNIKGIPGYFVKNSKIGSLPSTGGIGTILFSILGCAAMLAGVGLFFANRRKAYL